MDYYNNPVKPIAPPFNLTIQIYWTIKLFVLKVCIISTYFFEKKSGLVYFPPCNAVKRSPPPAWFWRTPAAIAAAVHSTKFVYRNFQHDRIS